MRVRRAFSQWSILVGLFTSFLDEGGGGGAVVGIKVFLWFPDKIAP